ncbi:MAG: hypothetical protein ACRDBY_14325 [Cetobacterium sp.]
MSLFRKKPVVVEAFEFGVDYMPDWFVNRVSDNTILLMYMGRLYPQEGYCVIKTLEGEMIGHIGDYIIKGIRGEIYPCRADIFKKSYEQIG